jgi:hypothetical protein
MGFWGGGRRADSTLDFSFTLNIIMDIRPKHQHLIPTHCQSPRKRPSKHREERPYQPRRDVLGHNHYIKGGFLALPITIEDDA